MRACCEVFDGSMNSSMCSRHVIPIVTSCGISSHANSVLSNVEKKTRKIQLIHIRPWLPRRAWRIAHDTRESWAVRCSLPVRSETPVEATPGTAPSPPGNLVDTDSLGDAGVGLYTPFVDHCVKAIGERMEVSPFPMKVQPETGTVSRL